MKEYYRIGEISKLYHIGVDSLRYYEELGIIHPKRAESGYRLYSIQEIWRLNVIRDLRELGFGMEQIKDYLDCHTVATTLDLLQQEQEAIERKLQALRRLQANVTQRMQTIHAAQKLPQGEIRLERFPERHCFCSSRGYQKSHEMDVLIKELINLDQEHLYVIGSNQIGTFLSLEDFRAENTLQYEQVFVFDDSGTTSLPGGAYLTVAYGGDYGQSRHWIQALIQYADQHGLSLRGPILELLWVDIHVTSNVQEFQTQLQVLVNA